MLASLPEDDCSLSLSLWSSALLPVHSVAGSSRRNAVARQRPSILIDIACHNQGLTAQANLIRGQSFCSCLAHGHVCTVPHDDLAGLQLQHQLGARSPPISTPTSALAEHPAQAVQTVLENLWCILLPQLITLTANGGAASA